MSHPLDQPVRLYVLGDSVSIQYGPHLEQALGPGWAYARKSGEAEAMQDLDIPQGANGGDSGMCARFLDAQSHSDEAEPDVLLINCGLHDVKTDATDKPLQTELSQYEQNLEWIVVISQRWAQHTVWVRTTPVHEPHHNRADGIWRFNRDVDAYNAVADRVMKGHGIPRVDLHGFSRSLGPPADLLPDGRHFTPEAQRLQGVYLAGWLKGWWAGLHQRD